MGEMVKVYYGQPGRVGFFVGGFGGSVGGHLKLLFLLILSWNLSSTSSFCPPYCICDDIALSVNCHSASNLRVVPIFLNPQIKFLSLAKNQIKDITLSLQFYAELQLLDISQNTIDSLGKQNFELLKSLKVLNVSYNSLKALENGVFTGLGTTEVLDLTGNQIERVEREIFWNLRKAKEIILDRNRLEFLDWDLFRGLDTLERISVKFNFIQVIEPSPSLGPNPSQLQPSWSLKSVRVLDVSSNQLTRVKDNSLVIFGALRELNLCCNYIHTLEDKAFVSGGQLERVNLSQNRLGRVPSDSLDKVASSLRELDLSSNRISDQLSKTVFRGLLKLESLRISDNPGILTIDPDSLSENINLVTFEADYLSNLTELSPTLLSNKPNLKHFSVKYGQISVLSPELVEPPVSNGVRSLDLTGNPIECNCSVYPVFQYLRDHQESSSEEVELDLRRLNSQEDKDFVSRTPTFLGSNLSQAQYVHPNPLDSPADTHRVSKNSNTNTNSNNNNPRQRPPSHLFSLRCQSPSGLAGIPVKDLKPSDFEDCFAGEDDFQVLVICIAAGLLSLIFLAIGIKLCCAYGGCRRLSAFCKARCSHCCHLSSKNNNDKSDKLYDSMVGLRRDLPPLTSNNGNYNTASTNCTLPPTGKLFVATPTSSGSPSHHVFYSNNPSTLNNYNTCSSNRIHMDFTNGYPHQHQTSSQQLQQLPLHNGPHGHNTLGSSAGTGSKSNKYHQPSNYPSYPPPPPPPTANPPVILHYEYQYPDYPGSIHRVKQVPSVLV